MLLKCKMSLTTKRVPTVFATPLLDVTRKSDVDTVLDMLQSVVRNSLTEEIGKSNTELLKAYCKGLVERHISTDKTEEWAESLFCYLQSNWQSLSSEASLQDLLEPFSYNVKETKELVVSKSGAQYTTYKEGFHQELFRAVRQQMYSVLDEAVEAASEDMSSEAAKEGLSIIKIDSPVIKESGGTTYWITPIIPVKEKEHAHQIWFLIRRMQLMEGMSKFTGRHSKSSLANDIFSGLIGNPTYTTKSRMLCSVQRWMASMSPEEFLALTPLYYKEELQDVFYLEKGSSCYYTFASRQLAINWWVERKIVNEEYTIVSEPFQQSGTYIE